MATNERLPHSRRVHYMADIPPGLRVRWFLIRAILVRLLAALVDENREMSKSEQRRYSLGVRALARYSRRSVSQVLTELHQEAAQDGFTASFRSPEGKP